MSGSFGDNQQSFWLTATQTDWSLGEQQRYFRQADPASSRRYWAGNNINVGWTPGQVTMEYAQTQVSLGFSAITCLPGQSAQTAWFGAYQCMVSDEIHPGATRVHGASLTSSNAVCQDGQLAYIGDATHIRSWDYGSTFATFSSATGSACLAYVSNTLFSGFQNTLSWLDTSGNSNLVYSWKSADGTSSSTRSPQPQLMTAYGGQVMVVVVGQPTGGSAELWLADTTGAQRVGALPSNFVPQDICLADEIVFFSGVLKTVVGVNANFGTPAVFYYANGNIGKLWQSKGNGAGPMVSCAPCRGGVVFNDPTQDWTQIVQDPTVPGGQNASIVYYDISQGGVSTIGTYPDSQVGNTVVLAGGDKNLALSNQTSTGHSWFSVYASTGAKSSLQTSLFDFDSALTKLLRGVTVDWTPAATADSASNMSVDLDYQLDTLDGAWTSLAASVTSGQEYTFPTNTTARAVAVRATLNLGSSIWGPMLKRIYVRAAPEQQTFRLREYILDLSGIGFKDPVQLNDGTEHPLSGHEQATNLMAAIIAKQAVTISDRFGTFTGILEPTSEVYEVREGNDSVNFSGGFVAKVDVREI